MSNNINYRAKTTKELVIMLLGVVNTVCKVDIPSINTHLATQNSSISKLKTWTLDHDQAHAIAEAVKVSRQEDQEVTKKNRRVTDEKRYRRMKIWLLIAGGVALPSLGFVLSQLIGG